jgi:hypothetical protein
MANGPQIIIPRIHRAGADPIDLAAEDAARSGLIPLRIKCPDCSRIYTLFIKDFNQGLHVLLGQACPYCKRFIKESDDPDALLVDAKPTRESIQKEKNNG